MKNQLRALKKTKKSTILIIRNIIPMFFSNELFFVIYFNFNYF